MREIEFRAFIDKEVIGDDCGLMHYPNDSSDFELVCNGDGGFSMVVDHQQWVESDKFSIMQYIGMKDEDGKKLFEGDIVDVVLSNRQPPFRSENFIGQVYWSEFEWAVETTDDHWPVASWKCVDKCKVIGNIHENPELIN